MGRFLGIDSPIIAFLNRVCDIIWLNILTLICCIPVVTAGAAFTAMHYVALKMAGNEEGYITKSFFKSFLENFRQATIIWLLSLLVLAVFIGDIYAFAVMGRQMPAVVRVCVSALFLLFAFGFCYVFPVLARFENSIFHTIKNAFLLSILHFPKTVIILIIYALPALAGIFFLFYALPVLFMAGFSLPAYLCAYFYAGIFKKIMPEEEKDLEEHAKEE